MKYNLRNLKGRWTKKYILSNTSKALLLVLCALFIAFGIMYSRHAIQVLDTQNKQEQLKQYPAEPTTTAMVVTWCFDGKCTKDSFLINDLVCL
jgi:hypothetical protein